MPGRAGYTRIYNMKLTVTFDIDTEDRKAVAAFVEDKGQSRPYAEMRSASDQEVEQMIRSAWESWIEDLKADWLGA